MAKNGEKAPCLAGGDEETYLSGPDGVQPASRLRCKKPAGGWRGGLRGITTTRNSCQRGMEFMSPNNVWSPGLILFLRLAKVIGVSLRLRVSPGLIMFSSMRPTGRWHRPLLRGWTLRAIVSRVTRLLAGRSLNRANGSGSKIVFGGSPNEFFTWVAQWVAHCVAG